MVLGIITDKYIHMPAATLFFRLFNDLMHFKCKTWETIENIFYMAHPSRSTTNRVKALTMNRGK